jgi:acyl-CoA dehydrogenase
LTLAFDLSPEQDMLTKTARRIGDAYGLEYWRTLDREQQPPREMWAAICAAGLAGAALPEEHGGSGLGMLDLALVIETLCATGAGMPLAQLFMLNPVFGGHAIARFGTERMKRELLPGLIDGTKLLSFALTEPDAGNNSLNITTQARRTASGWVLSGQKTWITLADETDLMLVVARTMPLAQAPRRTEGLSMFLFDARRQGVRRHKIDKSGTRALPAYTVFFDEVEIDERELIGTRDGAWPELVELLNGERIVTAAGLVGAGELAIRLACNYANERKVFKGAPIGSYQGVQFPLAHAHAELECARLMNRKAAWLMDQGQPFGSEANTAKLIAAQAACNATDRAVQTLGGMGFATEYHVERLWRDTRVFAVAPIPQEMILGFIATHDLGLPRSY